MPESCRWEGRQPVRRATQVKRASQCTYDIAGLDSGPVVHLQVVARKVSGAGVYREKGKTHLCVLIEPIYEDLSYQLYTGVESSGPNVAQNRCLFKAHLGCGSSSERPRSHPDVGSERRFVRREGREGSRCPNY